MVSTIVTPPGEVLRDIWPSDKTMSADGVAHNLHHKSITFASTLFSLV